MLTSATISNCHLARKYLQNLIILSRQVWNLLTPTRPQHDWKMLDKLLQICTNICAVLFFFSSPISSSFCLHTDACQPVSSTCTVVDVRSLFHWNVEPPPQLTHSQPQMQMPAADLNPGPSSSTTMTTGSDAPGRRRGDYLVQPIAEQLSRGPGVSGP